MNMKTDEKINEPNHQCQHHHQDHKFLSSARLVPLMKRDATPSTVARRDAASACAFVAASEHPVKQDVINLGRQKQHHQMQHSQRSVSEPPPIEYLLMRSFNSMTTSFSFSLLYGKDGLLPSASSEPLNGNFRKDNEGDFEC